MVRRCKMRSHHGSAITIGILLLLQSIFTPDCCRALQRNGKGTRKMPLSSGLVVPSSTPTTRTNNNTADEDEAEDEHTAAEVDGPPAATAAVEKNLTRSAEDHDTLSSSTNTSTRSNGSSRDIDRANSRPKVGTTGHKNAAGDSLARKSMAKSKDKTKRKKQNQHQDDLNDKTIQTGVGSMAEKSTSNDVTSRHGEEPGSAGQQPASTEKSQDDDSAETVTSSNNDSTTDEARVAHSKVDNDYSDNKTSSLLPHHLGRRARIPPPNGIYRFFLNKGIIGRLLVMLFILITEFVSAFIPAIGTVIKAILPKSLLTGSAHGGPQSGSFMSSSSSSSQRRKHSRSEQLRAADQAALQQLKRASKEGGKYRHVVSFDFMQRHEIGPYAAAHDDVDNNSNDDVKSPKMLLQSSGYNSLVLDGEHHRPVATAAVTNQDDEDADWIIEALSSDKQQHDNDSVEALEEEEERPSSRTRKRRKIHSNAFQRESRLHAAIKLPKRKKKIKRNSFGSILLGQFASSDNRFSRNLLGAYPGDAAPLEHAASASGLSELARKYGWGDWPEEDDHIDDDDQSAAAHNGLKGRKKRKRQPMVEKASKNQVRFDFGFGTSPSDDFDEWNSPFGEISSITRSRRHSVSLGVDDGERDILNARRPADEAERPKASTETTLNPSYTSSKRPRSATELLTERRKFVQENESPD